MLPTGITRIDPGCVYDQVRGATPAHDGAAVAEYDLSLAGEPGTPPLRRAISRRTTNRQTHPLI